jgi:hypothetical protein
LASMYQQGGMTRQQILDYFMDKWRSLIHAFQPQAQAQV